MKAEETQKPKSEAVASPQADMDDKVVQEAIARLRAEKARVMDSRFSKGREAGEEWAVKFANFAELEALVSQKSALLADRPTISLGRLAEYVANEDERDDFVDDMAERYGCEVHHQSWVVGFTSGAVSKGQALLRHL